MPTAQVVAKYDQLTQSIVYLLDLKKSVDKLEAEHRTKTQRTPFGRDVMSLIPHSKEDSDSSPYLSCRDLPVRAINVATNKVSILAV